MAESFTLWNEETFTGPFADGVVAVSQEINNTQGFTGLEVVVEYSALTPDAENAPADYKLSAVIEQKSGMFWYPIAYQFRHINNSESPLKRIIILGPNVPDFNGSENLMFAGDTALAAQSFNNGALGDKFRVKLIVDNNGTYPLTSVGVTAYGRKVD